MGKKLNLMGKTFGRLTVISECDRRNNRVTWRCLCECGIIRDVLSSNLTSGYTISCGCYRNERIKIATTTHGKSGKGMYISYQRMKDRCYNPNNNRYKNYGGRGIKVCDRWLESFENFLEDMENGYFENLQSGS